MPKAQLYSQIVAETQLESQIVPERQLEDHSLEPVSSHRTTPAPRVTSTPRRQANAKLQPKEKPKVPPKPKEKTPTASTPSARKRQGSSSNVNSAAKRKATGKPLLSDNIGVENCSNRKGSGRPKKKTRDLR